MLFNCSTYKNDSLVSFKRDKKNTDLFNKEIKNYFQEVINISIKANKAVEGFILFKNYDYFNAVAKGYAVDIVSSKLKELNIENFFINIGGEIRAEGMKNKNFWKIGIENPLPNRQSIFKPFKFKQNLSIATSGNYRNPGHIVGIEGNEIQRQEIRRDMSSVKHQDLAGSTVGDTHKEYFSGDNALKAGGEDNTMNQF